jgi:hypothetical protein
MLGPNPQIAGTGLRTSGFLNPCTNIGNQTKNKKAMLVSQSFSSSNSDKHPRLFDIKQQNRTTRQYHPRGCHRERGWNRQISMLENGRFYHSMYVSQDFIMSKEILV